MTGPWDAFSSASAQGTKPGNLAKPVPGAEAVSVPQAVPVKQAAAVAPSPVQVPQAVPEQAAAQGPWTQFAAPDTGIDQAEAPSLMQRALSAGGTALGVAGQVLDYPGGLMRTGLASSLGFATGKGLIVTEDDLKKAFTGHSPSASEYMARLGVPELGSVDVKLIGKVSGRGVAGFVADIATDPLTAIAKMAKEVPYISKLINAPGAAADAVGEAIYKSSLSKIDSKVAQRAGLEGATPVADALLQSGAPIGNTGALAKKVEDISNSMGKVRQAAYDKAKELGVTVDMGFPMGRAEAYLEKLRANPGTEPAAEAFAEMLERYKAGGKVDIGTLSSWKTSLYNAVPKSAWAQAPEMRNLSAGFKTALAADFADAIVGAGNKAEKGLGDAIEHINSKWGPLLDAKDPLAKAAARPGVSFGGNQIDHTILSLGGVSKLLIKKGLDIATTTTGRTFVGRALMNQAVQQVTNRGIINAARPSPLQPPPEDQGGQ